MHPLLIFTNNMPSEKYFQKNLIKQTLCGGLTKCLLHVDYHAASEAE